VFDVGILLRDCRFAWTLWIARLDILQGVFLLFGPVLQSMVDILWFVVAPHFLVLPLCSMNRYKVLISLGVGKKKSISISKPSWLKSSKMLKSLNFLPSGSLPYMKSIDHVALLIPCS
jgi:hypothetical protein